MDFAWNTDVVEQAARTQSFIEREVVPLEARATEHEPIEPGTLTALRQRAREAGVYGPQIDTAYGGLGLDLLSCVPVFEAAGRSLLGPLALHCAAPDEGNMHTLSFAGSPAQKDQYLRPLAEGRVRSAFAMTEPAPGAGSDPTAIRTTARRDGSHWVLDGRKWFITGADGAAFFLVMARSQPDVHAYKGCTLFIVDADTPGLKVVRRIGVIGDLTVGGHCEVELQGVRVHESSVLGGVDAGFGVAQKRLGPARLTHCMRWTGVAQRALEIASARAQSREAFGEHLSDKQAIQWMLADSHVELETGRLLVQRAAWKIGTGDEARVDTSMAKLHVAEAVHRVVDRALQICGSLGVSTDLPLAMFYREARAFRIYDGPSEVHRMVVARDVLRRWR